MKKKSKLINSQCPPFPQKCSKMYRSKEFGLISTDIKSYYIKDCTKGSSIYYVINIDRWGKQNDSTKAKKLFSFLVMFDCRLGGWDTKNSNSRLHNTWMVPNRILTIGGPPALITYLYCMKICFLLTFFITYVVCILLITLFNFNIMVK